MAAGSLPHPRQSIRDRVEWERMMIRCWLGLKWRRGHWSAPTQQQRLRQPPLSCGENQREHKHLMKEKN